MPASSSPPATLAAVLEGLLDGQPRKDLQARALRMSEGFRARKPSSETIRDETDALAYALTRLPATYAATARVFLKLREEVPEFAPSSLVDAGCGLASASFAALEIWPDVASVELFDHSPQFLALAARLTQASPHSALAGARVVAADLRTPPRGETADLVVASYALTEIDDDALPGVLDALWARSGRALALIEPGTPRDYTRLMTLRRRLIEAGARIALPCPHDRPCPLVPPDWCHFATRLPRSRDHKLLKVADAPFEDEKFSYIVALRGQAPLRRARIIAPPRLGKWGVALRLCASDGIEETSIAKRDKAFFKNIRKSAWGDVFNADPESEP
ncbi:MAG: small ribosomal subunit Rsm22 family protein [Methylocystis sp.]